MIGRRRWLQMSALAAAYGVSGMSRARAAPAAARRRVVIVGAGLAGLVAAYELEQRGHEVVLLEAEKSHVGGRVRTLRIKDELQKDQPHAGEQENDTQDNASQDERHDDRYVDLYGELGAMRIPASHHLTRHYIKLFGLALRPFVQYDPEAYYYVHGQRKRLKQITHLNSLYTYGMDGQHGSVWAEHFDEIVGGMDLLPAAFAAHLTSRPRFGCTVIRLEQNATNGEVAAKAAEMNGQTQGRLDALDSGIERVHVLVNSEKTA